MMLADRPEPRPGEHWIDMRGQKIEIVEVKNDPQAQKSYVVYRYIDKGDEQHQLPMSDFMDVLGEGDNTLMCCFQKIEE